MRLALRFVVTSAAAVVLLAGSAQGVAAKTIAPADDGRSAALVGTGPVSPTTPARPNGGPQKPDMASGGGTKGGTKNGSKSGTGSKSKGKSASGTGSVSKAKTVKPATVKPASKSGTGSKAPSASNTGTNSASKATTAGTNHQTGTITGDTGEQPTTAAPTTAAPTGGNNETPGTTGTTPTTVLGVEQAPQGPFSDRFGNPTTFEAIMSGQTVAGSQQSPQATLGLAGLPSTSSIPPTLPAGTIALLSMGGALYAIHRKRPRR
ncbi:MAG: hypothetical protein HYX56_01155 [Chloroflexi bacterium]|nr:hypothetical protein [Chloroflexota bacterium]